ncbi:hypothetical protein BX600DRAFT_446389, partial [Xylariales sp. PMI_506]
MRQSKPDVVAAAALFVCPLCLSDSGTCLRSCCTLHLITVHTYIHTPNVRYNTGQSADAVGSIASCELLETSRNRKPRILHGAFSWISGFSPPLLPLQGCFGGALLD